MRAQTIFLTLVLFSSPSIHLPLAQSQTLTGSTLDTDPGLFSPTTSYFSNQTLINGCDPQATFGLPQFAQDIATVAVVGCATSAANNPGVNYNQTAGGWFFARTNGQGSGTGNARAVGVSTYGILNSGASNGFAYGGNPLVMDFHDSATGQEMIGQEVDVQPQKAASAYAFSGFAVEGTHTVLWNQGGGGGTYGPGYRLSSGTANAYWADAVYVDAASLCPACNVMNLNAQGSAATSSVNNNGYILATQYVNYWDGSTSQNESWNLNQPLVIAGASPNLDYNITTHSGGPGGQTHIFGYGNTINLGIQHSDNATWDEIAGSTGSGANYTNTLPGANGTLALTSNPSSITAGTSCVGCAGELTLPFGTQPGSVPAGSVTIVSPVSGTASELVLPSTLPPTGGNYHLVGNNTAGVVTTSWVTGPAAPPVIYSAAGTALPSCVSGLKGATAIVSDATSPTYLGTYTSGGAVAAPVMCNGSGWITY